MNKEKSRFPRLQNAVVDVVGLTFVSIAAFMWIVPVGFLALGAGVLTMNYVYGGRE